MNAPIAVRVYAALLALYPRRFRREYRHDMTLLFTEQLRDENAWRVCSRAAIDLALTVPTRYLEVVMKTPASPFVPTLFGAIAVAGLVSAVVSGSNLALTVGGVVVAVVAGGLSVASYRRNQPIAASAAPTAWIKVFGIGAGLFAALVVAVNISGEVPDGLWLPMIVTGLSAIALMAFGLILGVGRLATRSAR